MRKFLLTKQSLIFFGIIIAILLLAFLNYKGYLNAPKSFVYRIFSPIQKVFSQIGERATDYLSSIFLASKLTEQNQWLQEQNLKLQTELSQSEEISRENKILREQLGVGAEKEFNLIMAYVFGYSPHNMSHFLIIDKGTKQGLRKGLPVVSAGNILVGQVLETFDWHSTVRLLKDEGSAINVITQKTRTTGILKGDSVLGLALEMIPQELNLEIGEKVITSGLSENIPRGLLIGEIEEIISSDIEIFKKAKVKPAVNCTDLEIVFVITQ